MTSSTCRILCMVALPLAQAVAQVSGTVSDDMTRKRIAGAVVIPLDSAGKATGRFATDITGTFRITIPGTARLRVIKLGFRPQELAVTRGAEPFAIVMERLPNLLEPVRTSEQPRCGRNRTRPEAFGLWEQARAGLLEAVIAREANTAQVTRINFRRYMTPNGQRTARQTVTRETGVSLRSFDAVFSATDFARNGFVRPDSDGALRFYGPDAEVLLDEALPTVYCLQLADAQKARPGQVGLRFRPMLRQEERVDIDGTLWIDTSARVLKEIEFAYMGLEPWSDAFKPGGRIAFRELSAGALWIDQWHLRLTGATIGSRNREQLLAFARRVQVTEAGAEIDAVYWPDGREWRAALGTAELRVTTSDGRPYPGARVQLAGTDYESIADSSGVATIGRLLPGPYLVGVYDSVLAVIDTMASTGVSFVAARDSVFRATVVAPSAAEALKPGCEDRGPYSRGSFILAARLVTQDGASMSRGQWILEGDHINPLTGTTTIAEGETGDDGLVLLCQWLTRGARLRLRAWPPGRTEKEGPVASAGVVLTNPVTTLTMIVHSR